MSEAVFIVKARRTPQGRFLGALAKSSVLDLGVTAGAAALDGVDPALVDETIVGHVLGAGQGLNIARQIALELGVPQEKPAFTVNMACASGLQAVSLAAQAIRGGEARVVLCGGAESMSNAPYLLPRARTGYKLGHGQMLDAILQDGLMDLAHSEHMGDTAERLASEMGITRADQDAFAARSHARAVAAIETRAFADELVAVGDVDRDEHPRPDSTAEKLATLKPVFNKEGTITAGNASGINDGAAMLLVASESAVKQHGWSPLARIEADAKVGCDPQRMGLGPVFATKALCEKAGLALGDFGVVEINEAFAAQAIACCRQLELPEDAEHFNAHGGAVALGHPVGASGGRLAVHVAHAINRGEAQRGLASLCVGGGMGIAMSLVKA